MKNEKERTTARFIYGRMKQTKERQARQQHRRAVQAHTHERRVETKEETNARRKRRKEKQNKKESQERNDESSRLSAPLVTQMAPRSHLSCTSVLDIEFACVSPRHFHPSLLCVFFKISTPTVY